jgi:hypothetical protein
VGAFGIILRFATTVYDRPATIRYLTRSPVDKRKFNTDGGRNGRSRRADASQRCSSLDIFSSADLVADGTVADRLVGNVVIVFEEKAFRRVTPLAQSPAIIPTLEPLSRETSRKMDLTAEAERLFTRARSQIA